jgi:hypothetical protein
MYLKFNCMNFSKNRLSHKNFMYNMPLKMYKIYIYNFFQYSEYLKNYAYKIKFDFTF